MTRAGDSGLPATVTSDGVAAAEIEHHRGRELEARQHEGGIDAALEAVARVRIDAELAAGLRDVERDPTAPTRSARRSWSAEQPVASPPMMPASDSTPFSSAITHIVSSSA